VCGQCGTAISSAPAAEIRRTATIVTSDLKGSTALGERLDPESLREVMTTYINEMQAVFEAHGGTIEKIIGDAIVAVFGLPTEREDDALRAVEAAAESQRALASLNDRLEQRWGVRLTVRTGVASGDVVVGEAAAAQHVLTGPTIAIATAMEQNSPPQEVLMAESTYELVRDSIEAEPMEAVTPKGSTLVIPTYRLISVAEHDEVVAPEASAGMRICQTCGEENPEDFTYCGNCGAPLAPRKVIGDTRKTVTIVFADPKPHTADGSPPTPEALRDVMSRYFSGMQAALSRHGATVEKFIGDAVMAVFGLPIRHEDDALRAVRAARDMQAALPALNEAFQDEYGIELGNHIGVNTGEVVAGDASLGQRLVTGDTVNVAARLEQSAGEREILLGDLTYRLVRDAVTVEEVEPLTLKGKSEPVPAYRLVSVSDAAQGVQRRSDTPMVGREEEMGALRDLFAAAVSGKVCRMATVVGDAGVGKTRLVAEFTNGRSDEALVIRGRCLPYGDGITFWPLREAVRDAAGIAADDGVDAAMAKLHARIPDPDVCDRLASVIGLSDQPFPVPEVFWGARKFLEQLGRERPVLMVVDDIHWAEATFLELIGNLVESVEAAPAVLLCTSRHELIEKHDDWATGDGMLRLVLKPLTDADAGRVVEALLGGTGLDDAVRGRIIQAAAGNPLFVEQLLSMLIDEGTLQRQDDHWVQVGGLARLDVPPTIQALLASRLDRLDPEERGVIEPASVIGQNFARAAVTALVTEPIAPTVPQHLEDLHRKQLIQPNPGAADTDEAGYRFHHLLVRDAAYGGLLKRSRAELHERFVDWAEEFNRTHGVDDREFEEIHGFHLEQAYRYLTELGTMDDRAIGLGIRASMKLSAAGRRAFSRGDTSAAANLLRRAVATRVEHDIERVRLLPDLGEALIELGEFDEADQTLEQAIQLAVDRESSALAAEAELIRLLGKMFSGGEEDWPRLVTEATAQATPVFEAEGLHGGLALVGRLLVGMYGTAGRYGQAAAAAEQVIREAHLAGDLRLERRGAVGYAQAALWGPTEVGEALARTEDLVASAQGDRRTEALIRLCLAQLHAMQGAFESARTDYRQAQVALQDLGGGVLAAATSTDSGRVELLAGDLVAARRELERDYRQLGELGESYLRSTVGHLLARVAYLQGAFEEADRLAREVEGAAADDDTDVQVSWRSLRALIDAHREKRDEAERMTAEAIRLSRGTDSTRLIAQALADGAEVSRLGGRTAEAAQRVHEAMGLYRVKGDRTSATRLKEDFAA
jgi:class 3 adenylate cyclase/tetratricopeptide (TPR) repeat protein